MASTLIAGCRRFAVVSKVPRQSPTNPGGTYRVTGFHDTAEEAITAARVIITGNEEAARALRPVVDLGRLPKGTTYLVREWEFVREETVTL